MTAVRERPPNMLGGLERPGGYERSGEGARLGTAAERGRARGRAAPGCGHHLRTAPEPGGGPARDAEARYRPRRAVPPRHRRRSGLRRAGARQSGFVTAELAAVLPVVVAVLALSVWAVATVGMKIRAIDAANSAALAAARGEDAHAVAAPYLPPGGTVSIEHDGDMVRATVTASSRPLGALTPAVEVDAHASVPKEPGLFE